LSGTRRFAVRGAPLSRQVGDEVFVLTADSQMHWMKNDTASFIWGALVEAGASGVALDTLLARLTEAFEVGVEDAREEVLGFISELERAGLVASIG